MEEPVGTGNVGAHGGDPAQETPQVSPVSPAEGQGGETEGGEEGNEEEEEESSSVAFFCAIFAQFQLLITNSQDSKF